VTQITEEKSNHEKTILDKDFLVILSGSFAFLALVVTPTLLLMGTIYQQSYWDAFGLDPGLFVIPKEWAVLVGFIKASTLTTVVLMLIAGYALAFAVPQGLSQWLSKSHATKVDNDTRPDTSLTPTDSVTKAEKNTRANVSPKATHRWSRLLLSVIGAAAILSGMTLLAIGQMQVLGRQDGEEELRAFAHGESKKNNQRVRATVLDRVHGNNVRVLDGYRIRCSEKWCAFYLSPVVEIIRTDDILFISVPALPTPP
jgi:hypothetical protein